MILLRLFSAADCGDYARGYLNINIFLCVPNFSLFIANENFWVSRKSLNQTLSTLAYSGKMFLVFSAVSECYAWESGTRYRLPALYEAFLLFVFPGACSVVCVTCHLHFVAVADSHRAPTELRGTSRRRENQVMLIAKDSMCNVNY